MKVDIKHYLIFFLIFPKTVHANSEIKIGLLAPFSGEFKSIGKSVLRFSEIALNKDNNDKINILPRDTKGNNLETLKKVEELYIEGQEFFIGPVFNKNLKRT